MLSASGPIRKAGGGGGGGGGAVRFRPDTKAGGGGGGGGGGTVRSRHDAKSGEVGGRLLSEEGEVPYMKGGVATPTPPAPYPTLELNVQTYEKIVIHRSREHLCILGSKKCSDCVSRLK